MFGALPILSEAEILSSKKKKKLVYVDVSSMEKSGTSAMFN